jgi:lipid II:glycine glycyltransferase (peptidoglycan interpeptide bridge formation enzyme)
MTQGESYNISEITDKQIWDNFVTSRPNHTFLHSWAWGEFNAAMAAPGEPRPAGRGDTIWRLGAWGGSLVAVALVIKVHARRGTFLFVPHGPLGDKAVLPLLVDEIRELAKQEKVSFIRISPLLEDNAANKKLFSELGFRPAPIHMHAETTWTLDLTPSEDELLGNMRKTTRNLIRRAQKEGVEVRMARGEQDVELFNTLYQETVKKHHFTPFLLTYLKKQVIMMIDTQVFTAYYRGQPLASAIIVFYGNSAFYHHGASVPSKIPAAYLLQWEAIREAKRRGHKFYNFWGIIKEDAPKSHPWQGITLFKKGFGGFQSDYLHAQDLPLSWKYWPNWIIETFRKKRRNL